MDTALLRDWELIPQGFSFGSGGLFTSLPDLVFACVHACVHVCVQMCVYYVLWVCMGVEHGCGICGICVSVVGLFEVGVGVIVECVCVCGACFLWCL